MSRETLTWLNQNTLVGFLAKRGHAWHYRSELQGNASNHYDGAVPVGDVQSRLFEWDAISRPVHVNVPAGYDDMSGIDSDGMPFRAVTVDNTQAVVRSDTGDVLGIHSGSYVIHQYRAWLLDTVSTILGDTLSVGSAGLLQNGAVAWVSVEIPDTITTREGVAFRPNLLACTSHNGKLATTFQRVVTNVVCDNTMSAALSERGQRVKVKHSSKSLTRIGEVRDALNIVHQIAEDFEAQVAELCEWTVTPRQWTTFLDEFSGWSAEMPQGRSRTMAETKRDAVARLYRHDDRVAPWQGTAYGVVQAVNTFTQHEQIVRGAERGERNMFNALSGKVDDLDRGTVDMLRKVCV